jgi:hypothetical protein
MPTPQFPGVPNYDPNKSVEDNVKILSDHLIGFARYMNWLMLSLDTLNINRLDAKVIVTGTLDAGKVTVRADLTGGAYIQIDSVNGLVINDGTKETFHADINGHVTMTGATIQSATGYPKVTMDPSGNLFGAFKDALHSVTILNLIGQGVPGIRFWDQQIGKTSYIYYDSTTPEMIITVQGDFNIGASGDVIIGSGGQVIINGIPINSTLSNLQSQINSLSARVSALESA